jgi:hypothetical protein
MWLFYLVSAALAALICSQKTAAKAAATEHSKIYNLRRTQKKDIYQTNSL